jgi:Mg2+-importing ATPase
MMGTSSTFGKMFSMAGASLFLPILPMLPIQILLNNLLYDLSELPIPLDRVDPEDLMRPRHRDLRMIRTFMRGMGPISSLFDFLTFFVLIKLFHAGEALCHTGWFIESMATQVRVIFLIRTGRSPFKSRPNGWLLAGSLGVVATALLLPYSPAGARLGFVPPPRIWFPALALLLAAYLCRGECVKQAFYKRFAPSAG